MYSVLSRIYHHDVHTGWFFNHLFILAMCPHPQVSPPTPTNSLSNCVKDEYGEKAEEVKSQEKACKPHASPPIDQSLLIYFLSQMQVPVTGPNGQATLQTVQVHLAEQFP